MYLEVSKFSDTQVLWQEQTYLLVLISMLKDGVTGSSKGWCMGMLTRAVAWLIT